MSPLIKKQHIISGWFEFHKLKSPPATSNRYLQSWVKADRNTLTELLATAAKKKSVSTILLLGLNF